MQRKNPFERLLLIVIIATLLAYIIHLLVRIVNKIKKQIKVTRIKISVGFKQVSRIKDAKKNKWNGLIEIAQLLHHLCFLYWIRNKIEISFFFFYLFVSSHISQFSNVLLNFDLYVNLCSWVKTRKNREVLKMDYFRDNFLMIF